MANKQQFVFWTQQPLGSNIWIIFIILFLITPSLRAQSVQPQSINSAGKKAVFSQGTLSYTVGELMVLRMVDNDGNTLSSGFSAGSTVKVVSFDEPNQAVLHLRAYPNPASNIVYLDIQLANKDRIIATLSDFNGIVLFEGKYAGISQTISIPVAAYPAGMYLLSVRDTNQQALATYKIIKP